MLDAIRCLGIVDQEIKRTEHIKIEPCVRISLSFDLICLYFQVKWLIRSQNIMRVIVVIIHCIIRCYILFQNPNFVLYLLVCSLNKSQTIKRSTEIKNLKYRQYITTVMNQNVHVSLLSYNTLLIQKLFLKHQQVNFCMFLPSINFPE